MGRVRPDVVVVASPGLDEEPGLSERGEDFLVQTLVAEPSVEALDESVLLRFARRDVMPFEAALVRPFQHRSAGEFRSGEQVRGTATALVKGRHQSVENRCKSLSPRQKNGHPQSPYVRYHGQAKQFGGEDVTMIGHQ
jgi:hypothetical protein